MKGDILIIDEKHRKAARQVYEMIQDTLMERDKYLITVAGESGAGKSETAAALAEVLDDKGLKVLLIQQDDFFVYPPKTNAEVRRRNGGKVGPEEVRIELLDQIVHSFRNGRETIEKPLVIFSEDRITSEKIDTTPFRVMIVEGTYTTLLEGIDCRVFINRDLNDTRSDRLRRNREKQDEFLEKILKTEHEIISQQKYLADIIITREFEAIKNQETDD